MLRRAELRGFTLIEAAVAIAIVAILAGAIAPLAVKALNQQREFKTRDALKACFEGCFGSRERRVANMRSDFGFDPTATLPGLGVMVSKAGTSWSGVPAYGYNGSNFPWGWNGPYWSGSLDGSNNPVDGWGHPIQLTVAGGTFQMVSGGPDGSVATAGDNLVYPNIAPSYLAYNATVNVLITKASNSNITGTAVVRLPYGATSTGTVHIFNISYNGSPAVGSLASSNPLAVADGSSTLSFNLPAGGCQITFTPSAGGFAPFTLTLDLLPGETRNVDISL